MLGVVLEWGYVKGGHVRGRAVGGGGGGRNTSSTHAQQVQVPSACNMPVLILVAPLPDAA